MRQNNKRAFTLVEVLIVIVIIGILFIVLMANVDFSTDEAKETGTKAIMQSYKLAAETIALENSGFTNDKAELVKVLNKRLDLELQLYVEGGEIKSKQTDSWGKEFKFMQSTPVNTYGMFAIQSAGPDGLFDNGDDIIMENKYVVVNGVGQVVTEFPEIDPNHSHSYVLRVTEPLFLKSPATCTSAAVYYYSCDCGKMNGTEFDFGVPDPEAHGVTTKQHIKKVPVDYAVHKTDSQCSLCGTSLATVENPHRPDATGEHCVDCNEQLHIHIYDKEIEANQYKKNDANCTEPLTYYKSCECGAASPDETFTKGGPLGHDYSKKTLDYKASNATCAAYAKYYLICHGCGDKSSETYDDIDGGKSETNHVGGTRVEYTWVDDLRHIKDTICNGCGAKRSSITEPHVSDGECCHTHSYTKTVEATAYEKTALTCTSKAVYYKSCECGKSAQGATNETFEGSATPAHIPSSSATWDTNHNQAYVSCTRSGCTQKWTSTSVTEITTTTATCVTERQYKHRASINVNGTSKTFDCTGHTGTTNSSNHLQDPAYPKIESICKWYPCCETVIDDTHSWNVSAANCQTAKKCTDCGFVAEEATEHSGSLVFAKVAGICQKYSGCGCTYSDHDLGGAACTTAATCKRSGCTYSSGSALGHKVNTSSAQWNSDHTKVTFICSRTGCSKSWDLSTTKQTTTAANCVTSEKYKHKLTVTISDAIVEGSTSLECSGHTGSVNPSTHASDCVWEPVSSPTSTLCQKRSKCGAQDTSHDYNVSSITCGSSVTKKYCTTCDYVAQTRPAHTSVNGGVSNVHKKCSVCNTTLQDGSYHNCTLTSGGATCDQTATYSCACGYSYQSTSSHNWEIIQEDTCLGEGKRKCKKCDKEETFNNVDGHNFPSSGEPSWNGCNPYYSCRNSGCTERKSLSKTKDVTTSANCITYEKYRHKTTQGGTTYYCGTTHTGEKAPNTHASSCTLAWKGVQNICQYRTGCGITTKGYSDHVWNVTSVTQGGPDKKCTNCGYIDEYAPSCTHNMVKTNNASGNCKECSICDYYTTHSWSTATCVSKSTCSNCNLTKGNYGSHGTSVKGGSVINYKDCVRNGYRHYKCSLCGQDLTSSYIFEYSSGHVYDNSCDANCNVCGESRTVSHSWNRTSATCQYEKKCTVCQIVGEAKKDHNFQASWLHDPDVKISCTAGCNQSWTYSGTHDQLTPKPTCTTAETYQHKVTISIDGQSQTFICGTRHTGTTNNDHSWSNNCDKTCNRNNCDYTRTISYKSHVWTNDCDTACNNYGCSYTRTVSTSKHKYTNDCDASCNNSGCSYKRTILDSAHKFTDLCDTTCNNSGCSYTRSAKHNWVLKPAPGYEDNYHTSVCSCGASLDAKTRHSFAYTNQYSSGHLVTCTKCTYSKTVEHVYYYSGCTNTVKHAWGSGHNDTHDTTYNCTKCPYSHSVTYEACVWNSSNKCSICGQGKG